MPKIISNRGFPYLTIAMSAIFFFGTVSIRAYSQHNNRDQFILEIQKAQHPIVIDGILDEPDWLIADQTGDFYRVLPIDTGLATAQTTVVMTYSETYLYLGVTCYEGAQGDIIVESLRRDFSFGRNDNFLAFIDTYNDQTNGFSFGASAAGAQWDGLQANGGFVSLDWDCKWLSEVKQYSDRWVIEMAIPFRSIRYKEGLTTWGINFSRLDLKLNEKSSWAPVPRQFQTASLAFTGTLKWDQPPPKSSLSYSLIPYLAGSASKNFQPETKADFNAEAGLDAKLALGSSINLDLTINPDYSQVEVDQQVTNLDRFELFFPERRRFFLENRDLFTDFGEMGVRPFFSRRIGLQAPVRAGLKVSGKINEAWRVGFLNMQTGSVDTLLASNFTVASVQRQVLARSNLGFIFVNKQITEDYSDTLSWSKFNRVAGLDFNLASQDNRWTGKAFYHQSFSPGSQGQDFVLGSNLLYSTGNLQIGFSQTRVGADYRAEVGFVRRKGYNQFAPVFQYKFFPGVRNIEFHGPLAEAALFYSENFALTDRQISLGYTLRWLDRSQISAYFKEEFVQLQAPFDPTNSDGALLGAGAAFSWKSVQLGYISDLRKLLSYTVAGEYGGFYNGQRLNLESSLIYRYQPYGSLSMNVSYNKIELPEPYNDANFLLIGPKLDLTFTDKIFLTTFIQYNNQIDNINMNIRFQWRYQPVSDLFIVYTDNYLPSPVKVKNRAVVLKLSYWFN